MSESNPPPESKQLIATGDNTQTNQPTGMDSSKKQTVTLKLTLDDILEGGSQLDGRVISVSDLMKFIFENCKNAEDNNLTSQPLPSAQQEYDPDSQKLVDLIDNSKSTLNEASGLLQKCAENLEGTKALLRSLSESNKKIEDIEQQVEREIKSTTEAVMGLLKGLAGVSATVPTNDDDDDYSPDPKESDISEEPTDPSNDPSTKNEDSKESHPTDLTEEQSKHGSTESAAETDDAEDSSQVLPHSTTTQTPNEPMDSVSEGILPTETSSTLPLGSGNLSASKLDDKETVEDKLSEGDESKQQVLETELGGRSEEAQFKGASPQHEAELPQEPSALEDLNFDETPDAGIASQQTTEPSQEPSSPTESAIEKTPIEGKADNSGDAKVPELEEVQEHDSGPAERTLSRSQKRKLRKKENKKNKGNKNTEEEIVGSSEESPIEETGPQQEAELPQEPSALKDLPLSATQQTTEHSQEPSSPTDSATEKTPTDSEADNSEDAKVPELEKVQEHDSKPAEPTLSKSQKMRLKKKEKQKNKENKNTEEEEKPLLSMDVMLSLYIGAMIDIRAKRIEPSQVQLPSLLEEISLFHQKKTKKKYRRLSAEEFFDPVLGEGWKKKNDLGSKICQHIAHFYAQPAAKTCALDIVAYLYSHFYKVYDQGRVKENEGLPLPQLFAKFNRQLVSWITSRWSQSLKRYGTHRRLETEDKTNSCAWRDKPAEYSSNLRVVKRIQYYQKHQETFEDRLISGCYQYLIFQKENLNKYHDVLDFDLDSVCERPDQSVELRFFSTIFDFDRKLLKNLYEAQAIDPEPESESDYTEDEQSDEEEDVEKEKEVVAKLEMVTFVSLSILLSTMKSIHDGKVTLEKANFPDFLKEIYLFHKTDDYKNNYKNVKFSSVTLFLKLFGSYEEFQERVANEREFFSLLDNYCHDFELGGFATQFLEFVDHSYNNAPETSEDDATTTKANFVSTFVTKVVDTTRAWIFAQFESNVNDYNNYHLKRKENIRKSSNDTKKYNWKPAPQCFVTSNAFQDRVLHYINQSKSFYDGKVKLSLYNYLVNNVECNEFIDADIHFIMTRPGDSMKVAESKFFNSLYGFNKWSHWFSNYLLKY